MERKMKYLLIFSYTFAVASIFFGLFIRSTLHIFRNTAYLVGFYVLLTSVVESKKKRQTLILICSAFIAAFCLSASLFVAGPYSTLFVLTGFGILGGIFYETGLAVLGGVRGRIYRKKPKLQTIEGAFLIALILSPSFVLPAARATENSLLQIHEISGSYVIDSPLITAIFQTLNKTLSKVTYYLKNGTKLFDISYVMSNSTITLLCGTETIVSLTRENKSLTETTYVPLNTQYWWDNVLFVTGRTIDYTHPDKEYTTFRPFMTGHGWEQTFIIIKSTKTSHNSLYL